MGSTIYFYIPFLQLMLELSSCDFHCFVLQHADKEMGREHMGVHTFASSRCNPHISLPPESDLRKYIPGCHLLSSQFKFHFMLFFLIILFVHMSM